TEKDVAGPFVKVPRDMMERARLDYLGYESVVEALAERFHVSQELLRTLNRGKTFGAGDDIPVPDVTRPRPPAEGDAHAVAREAGRPESARCRRRGRRPVSDQRGPGARPDPRRPLEGDEQREEPGVQFRPGEARRHRSAPRQGAHRGGPE